MRIERRIAHLCCELVECVLEAINVPIHMAIARWRHIAILVLLHSAVGMAIGLDSRFVLQRMNLLAIYIHICILSYIYSYLAIALHVGALVEVREEEVEHNRVSANEVCKTDGIIAIVLEEQLERVHHDQNKLYHLHDCQIFLPPQITLYFGSHCGQHVVGVHEDVHEGVQEPKECRMSTRGEFNAPPDRNGHNTMMNDMQCGYLIVSLAHHKEERIEELGELGEIVPPAAPCRLQRERKRKPYKLYAI